MSNYVESKTVIRVEAEDQVLRVVQAPTVASGGVEEDAVEFELGDLWTGLTLFAVFYRRPEEVYHVPIEYGRCIVPHEVLRSPGCFYLGVMGVRDGVTRTSSILSYRVEAGAITEGIAPPTPTPSIYEEMLASMKATEQIAQSVRDDADAGAFDGEKGDKGDPGKDGTDATVTKDSAESALGYAPVKDVQVGGASVLADGVANVPVASPLTLGAIKQGSGIAINTDGTAFIPDLNSGLINDRASNNAVTAHNVDAVVKAAMCDGVGAAWTKDEQAAGRAGAYGRRSGGDCRGSGIQAVSDGAGDY